jgi:hypothetical protein
LLHQNSLRHQFSFVITGGIIRFQSAPNVQLLGLTLGSHRD